MLNKTSKIIFCILLLVILIFGIFYFFIREEVLFSPVLQSEHPNEMTQMQPDSSSGLWDPICEGAQHNGCYYESDGGSWACKDGELANCDSEDDNTGSCTCRIGDDGAYCPCAGSDSVDL